MTRRDGGVGGGDEAFSSDTCPDEGEDRAGQCPLVGDKNVLVQVVDTDSVLPGDYLAGPDRDHPGPRQETARQAGGLMQVSAVGFRAGYRVLVAAVKAAGVIEPRRRAATDRVFLHVGEDAVVVGARERGQAVDVTLPAVAATRGRLVLGHAALSKALTAAGKGCRKAELDSLQVGISLNLETEIAELDVDGYTVPLSCLSLDEFPNPLEEAGTPVVVDRDTFCDMFSRVVACACIGSGRSRSRVRS